jgi:hypothetical protein
MLNKFRVGVERTHDEHADAKEFAVLQPYGRAIDRPPQPGPCLTPTCANPPACLVPPKCGPQPPRPN